MRVGGPGTFTLWGQINRIIALAVVSMLVATQGLAQEKARYEELPNFHKVNERLYRGAQPKSGGIARLAELGIKTIINLRGADGQTRADEAKARSLGMTYFNIPMPGLSRPSHEQVSRVMAIIDAKENGPVFIHCKRGSDRTGTVVAIYRISRDNWTMNQAMFEAKRRGLHWIEYGMKDFISDYYRDHGTNKDKPSEKARRQAVN